LINLAKGGSPSKNETKFTGFFHRKSIIERREFSFSSPGGGEVKSEGETSEEIDTDTELTVTTSEHKGDESEEVALLI
jgi:hypothetical protein